MCGGDKTVGHNAARNKIYHLACAAGCQPGCETGGLLPPRPEDLDPSGGRRPADVYIPAWQGGAPGALDLAITSPQRQATLQLASEEAGAAAKLYEEHKRNYLNTEAQCSEQGLLFVPMVAKSSGGWGESGVKVLRKLAKQTAAKDGTKASMHMNQFLQSLSVIIRRASARALLRRTPCSLEHTAGPSDTAVNILS